MGDLGHEHARIFIIGIIRDDDYGDAVWRNKLTFFLLILADFATVGLAGDLFLR